MVERSTSFKVPPSIVSYSMRLVRVPALSARMQVSRCALLFFYSFSTRNPFRHRKLKRMSSRGILCKNSSYWRRSTAATPTRRLAVISCTGWFSDKCRCFNCLLQHMFAVGGGERKHRQLCTTQETRETCRHWPHIRHSRLCQVHLISRAWLTCVLQISTIPLPRINESNATLLPTHAQHGRLFRG